MRGVIRKGGIFLEMIKFPHTVFALPFAFMGAALAAGGLPSARQAFWILAAMVGARTGAMGVNRLADRELDTANPRTKDRALPRGEITPWEALAFVVAAFGLLLLAAYQLNPLCFALAPLAILVLVGYSYTKRFTTASHLILGLCLGLAPIGAWIAVAGRVALPALVLGAAVLLWVAGFDILYALADIEFDRKAGLFSIPARLGAGRGIAVSRLCHLATFLLLAALIPLAQLRWLYAGGLALAAGLLCYEHLLLERHGLRKLEVAFFNVNGILSIGLCAFTLADLLLLRARS